MLHRDPRTNFMLMLALILAAILSSCCVEQKGGAVVETTPEGLEIRQTAEGERYLVEPSKLASGPPPKGGISSIDSLNS
ncbi:MAG: hypothetical protein PHW56_01090 [Methanosarcinaceae archaeon]|nr:hypothetical protein [Methanosarcinaceae archaeon]